MADGHGGARPGAGRKTSKDEIRILEYLADLTEPTFKFIKLMYEAGDKADKKWAVEQLTKLYGKCIPQAGDNADNPLYQAQITGMQVTSGDKTGGTDLSHEQPKAEGSV